MRALLKSESRLLQRVILSCFDVSIESLPVVRHEVLIRSRDAPRFNDDFTLEFHDRPFPEEVTVGTCPALPDTIGPAINVLVEAATFQPLLLELMFGGSLHVSCYQKFIDPVRQRCRALVASPGDLQREHRTAVEALLSARGSFARVLVVDADVCFLIGTGDPSPGECAYRHNLAKSETEDIDICVSPDCAVWLDGWMTMGGESNPDQPLTTG